MLRNTDYPHYEVIVVDSGSVDGSVQEMKQTFAQDHRIRIIDVGRDVGYSEANNIGFREGRGDLIAFLNNDTEVASNWLLNLYQVLAYDDRIGCSQSKLLLMDYPQRIDSVGHIIDPLGFLRAEGYMEIDRGQYDEVREVCIVQPAACLTRRKVIEETGLFDADFFILHEDTDFSIRLHMRGYRILLVPSSVVYHKRSATFSTLPPSFLTFHARKNMLMTILKNYEAKNLIKYGFLHIFILHVMALWYLFNRRYSDFEAIIKALLWNLKNLKKTFSKRKVIQRRIRVLPDRELFRRMDAIRIPDLIRRRHQPPLVLSHLKSLDE